MVVDKTPPINTTGQYILRAPWTIPDPTRSYKCEAIDGFEALALRGVDVYKTYYDPKGDLSASYNEDKAAGINIITLIGQDATDVIYVPSSYILQYPNQFDVPYGRVVISVDVGPLPSDFPLADLKARLVGVATSITGNAAVVTNSHFLPIATFVTRDMETSLAEARSNTINEALSVYGSKLVGEQEIAKLTDRKDALEEIIKGKLGFG